MKIETIVPIITTSKMRETREFYVKRLGFEVSFDHDHYLGLRAGPKGSPELGFMLPDAESGGTYEGHGTTFAFSVKDADAAHARLVAAGVPIVQPPMDRPWGARSFVARDPNGVMLYVSHPIPAAAEFQAAVR
jgi:catechol 2,3-dioxygenase-like lactoylglutathione lyase family enzyme